MSAEAQAKAYEAMARRAHRHFLMLTPDEYRLLGLRPRRLALSGYHKPRR